MGTFVLFRLVYTELMDLPHTVDSSEYNRESYGEQVTGEVLVLEEVHHHFVRVAIVESVLGLTKPRAIVRGV